MIVLVLLTFLCHFLSLLRGKRAVLAGDHKQLPPTIKCSVGEVQNELRKTLFERLMIAYAKSEESTSSCRSKMLEVQYRMHQDISDWASNAMYNGKLISHESVRHRQLLTLPLVAENAKAHAEKVESDNGSLEKVTLMIVDTTGCDFHETANDAGSRYNEGEAKIVANHVHSLISLGLRAEDIAVITPYNGQVELLRKMLLPDVPKLEIRSVDGFQGGEREAVVISLVRSSDRGGQNGIGFLRDERRLNVAVTRAKRHCAVVCDCETVSKNKFIQGLVDWMEEKGECRSGAEYIDNPQTESSDRFQTKIAIPITLPPQKQPNAKQVASKNSLPNTKNKDSIKKAEVDDSKATADPNRIALMEKIKSFSELSKKGDELHISPSTDFDCVVARELAKQLGLGCRNSEGINELVLSAVKEAMHALSTPVTEEIHATTTSKFAKLSVDDESSVSSNEGGKSGSCNNLLRQLALEREKRQSEQSKSPPAKPSASKKKKKNDKRKGQKRAQQNQKEEKNDEKLDDLDDMAFLDAQIERVQTSHGRKVEGKGKGYRSIVSLCNISLSVLHIAIIVANSFTFDFPIYLCNIR